MKRRSFLTTSLASGAAIGLGLTAQSQETVEAAAYKRISCEEGFCIPEIVSALRKASGGVPSAWSGPIEGPFMPALLDLGEGRIRAMDKAGIDMQVLALASPGVQLFDPPTAMSFARLANDRLAEATRKNPTRLTGLCTVAPQDPVGAAKEMERAVRTLGFKGAVINSHTNGEYLDDPKYFPILEAAQALGVPLYIHPRDPSPGMAGPLTLPGFMLGWSYGVEAGTHALRLIAAGIFDRYPNLRIVLGHMGETLPFVLDRLDNRYEWEMKMFGKVKQARLRLPSEYFKNHFVVTTSGMNYRVPMMAAIAELGADRVLFAADYPMEEPSQAVAAVEAMELSMQDRWKVFETNARKVFAL
jgi:5-carboxyvanillate decarboxylase